MVRAYQPPPAQQVIRARSFELVNEAGETISLWGVDQGGNAVLAFGSRGLALKGARPHGVPAGLLNPENQLVHLAWWVTMPPCLRCGGRMERRGSCCSSAQMRSRL
jgi:hypothetical protein